MAIELIPINENLLSELQAFWASIPGVGLYPIDDSPTGLRRFLDRNPDLCYVARAADGRLAGTLLCGWDGRRARLYHVCVHPDFRGRGIAQTMVSRVLRQLRAMGVVKCDLVCFQDNEIGNAFWRRVGWVRRDELADWQMPLNPPPAAVSEETP